MRKERDIIVKVIENKKIYDKMLINFFAKKYYEKDLDKENREK